MITFIWVVFSVLVKGVLFWKIWKKEVFSRSLLLHFVKYHKKEPLSQRLTCCYIMALLFLETLSYCSIRKVSVSNNFFYPALFWLVENIFELIFIGLTLLLILYMDVNSHVKSVMKVGLWSLYEVYEEMRFSSTKKVKYKVWFGNQTY